MKNFGVLLATLFLAAQAQAQYTHMEKGTKFTCSYVPDNGFFFTVEVQKELKAENTIEAKYKVKVSESGPGLDGKANEITSILEASDIMTRTMAGGYYQVAVQHGHILSLKNLIYSIFASNPVGFYGKAVNLKYGSSTPVTCQFVGTAPQY